MNKELEKLQNRYNQLALFNFNKEMVKEQVFNEGIEDIKFVLPYLCDIEKAIYEKPFSELLKCKNYDDFEKTSLKYIATMVTDAFWYRNKEDATLERIENMSASKSALLILQFLIFYRYFIETIKRSNKKCEILSFLYKYKGFKEIDVFDINDYYNEFDKGVKEISKDIFSVFFCEEIFQYLFVLINNLNRTSNIAEIDSSIEELFEKLKACGDETKAETFSLFFDKTKQELVNIFNIDKFLDYIISFHEFFIDKQDMNICVSAKYPLNILKFYKSSSQVEKTKTEFINKYNNQPINAIAKQSKDLLKFKIDTTSVFYRPITILDNEINKQELEQSKVNAKYINSFQIAIFSFLMVYWNNLNLFQNIKEAEKTPSNELTEKQKNLLHVKSLFKSGQYVAGSQVKEYLLPKLSYIDPKSGVEEFKYNIHFVPPQYDKNADRNKKTIQNQLLILSGILTKTKADKDSYNMIDTIIKFRLNEKTGINEVYIEVKEEYMVQLLRDCINNHYRQISEEEYRLIEVDKTDLTEEGEKRKIGIRKQMFLENIANFKSMLKDSIKTRYVTISKNNTAEFVFGYTKDGKESVFRNICISCQIYKENDSLPKNIKRLEKAFTVLKKQKFIKNYTSKIFDYRSKNDEEENKYRVEETELKPSEIKARLQNEKISIIFTQEALAEFDIIDNSEEK